MADPSSVLAVAADRELDRLTASLRALDLGPVQVALVLGSGLGALAERFERARVIPYAAIEGMPHGSVPGHAGELVLGELAGVRVLAQKGRVHLYEGHAPSVVTRAVRAFVRLGVRAVVLTNAAGGLRAEWPPGTLMRITDHVNFQGRSFLRRAEAGRGSPYDPALGAALRAGAQQAGVDLAEGVYLGLSGPSYETPAEIRLFRELGVDAVGMSTVGEALAARAEGARVAAISLITNPAAGITGERLDHAEVVAAGRTAAQRFAGLLAASIPHLARAVA
jgi:purine-nucleoside phosphorylase